MSSESDSELECEYELPDKGMETESSDDDEDDPAAGRWKSGEAAQFLDDLLIRVLFETPSGFAIFLYDGFKLCQPNAFKEIWADFVDPAVAKKLVPCIASKPFENKAHAISQSTGVSKELAAMIRACIKPGQKLAVGNDVYKSIIEKEVHSPCVYDSAVEELMWGLKIQMQSVLPPENSDLTYEDCFPMMTGIYCFLKKHKLDVKREMMVTRQIVESAGVMYYYDRCMEGRRHSLCSVAECIKKISRIDTKDWDLLKIATALKIICCPRENVDVPKRMFPKRHLEKFKSDAPRYTMFLKASSLALYDEVYCAWKLRSKVGRELTRLIQLVNKVDVEQPHEAAIDQDDLDGKKIYPVIDPAILDELNECGTVTSTCRLDRQVPPNLARVDELEKYTHISSHSLHSMNKPGILCMDIHPLKDIVATGGMDTNAVLFDRLSGQILCTLTGHSKEITSLKFVNRDELIVTGSADKTVRIWQGSKDGHYSCIHTLKDHAAEVEAVTVHATQKYFVTASKDNSWCFYDTSTGSCLTKVGVEASGQQGYTSASFHPDGLVLGTGTTDGFVKIWDVKTQSKVAKLEGHVGPVTDMSFFGYFLATAALDGVKLWDIRKLTRDFSTIFPDTPTNAVEFDSSGCYLAVGGSDIRVCQVANAMVECNVIRALPDLSGTGKVTSVKFGTDATYITVGSMDRNLRIFGLQSCQPATQDKTVFC